MRRERKPGVAMGERIIVPKRDDGHIILDFCHQAFQRRCGMFEAFRVLQNAWDFVAGVITLIEIGPETKRERPQRRAAVQDHLQKRGDVLVHAFTARIGLVYVLQDDVSHGFEAKSEARTNGGDPPSAARELEGLGLVEYLYCLGVDLLVGSKDGVFFAVTVRFSN